MNEGETRAEHVDPALAAAGWGRIEGSRIRREHPITLGRLEGHSRRGKPMTADYCWSIATPSSRSSRPGHGTIH
jgi:type I restriction enzyme, R subunit